MAFWKKKKKDEQENVIEEELLQYEEKTVDSVNGKPKKRKKANRQILQITYIFVFLFLALMGYMIKFIIVDSADTIANSHNKRQTTFEEKVLRGRIISNNDKVLAQTVQDSNGNEQRDYPYGRMFAHVVGYNINGRSGLESTYNYQLLTSNANLFMQVVNSLRGDKNAGDDLYTTLDTRLQKAAYEALGSRNGAVIAMEPDTGKILAMVSKPDFDPNYIKDQWQTLNSSSEAVLVNRATQGLYAPGSTFKIVTALEYMRENSNYRDFSYYCNSSIIKNSNKISCYHGTAHGTVNLTQAIAKSCNTAFVDLGSDLNRGDMRELAEDLFFNTSIPVDIASKKSQFNVSKKTEKSQMPQIVIGQGDTLITPLNNALIMCAIANDGVVMKPYIADHIENYNGGVIKQYESSKLAEALSSDEANEMKEMLKSVVKDGTGSVLNTSAYTVAGKTGSAEYNSNKDSHAWFVGMSNVDDPDLVVSVIVERGGSGGQAAAPVAKAVFDSYYNNELNH
ncbi:MAG: penicillin-binding transpeptidase domain-containing protein [Lachnospiraceae bacterium]|nr:penicillin-binding transpeptidase domain-containing protein [Lachnospiraceae bacterium]